MSLTREDEAFDWDWIRMRGDETVDKAACLEAAPWAWRQWVLDGNAAKDRVRRRVLRLKTASPAEQLPPKGSKYARILDEILDFYPGKRKHRFEALAELIAEEVLSSSGSAYKRGWITPRSSDHGADFIARLDLADGFARTPIVVLGQAKCEAGTGATSGRDLARTVARLRRGWLGVYVTTTYFSTLNQEELYEDEYPLVLINGRMVAEVVDRMVLRDGHGNLGTFLKTVDEAYENRVSARRPSEILAD